MVPLNVRLVPENVKLLMAGTGTTVKATTRFTLAPLTENEAEVPSPKPVPVTVTVPAPEGNPGVATWIKL